jgi:hypothetical protein
MIDARTQAERIQAQRAARLARDAARVGVIPLFIVYWNKNHPHVTIHRGTCHHPKKHGGKHKYAQGGYVECATYAEAEAVARAIAAERGLPIKPCPDCHAHA